MTVVCLASNYETITSLPTIVDAIRELPRVGTPIDRADMGALIARTATPMLATPFSLALVEHFAWPAFAQIMCTGLRVVALRSDGMALDGQLSVAGWSHMEHVLHGRSRREWPSDVLFQAFDLISPELAHVRQHQLKLTFDRAVAECLQRVSTLTVSSIDTLGGLSQAAGRHSGDGLVLRNPNGLYRLGRSTDVLRLTLEAAASLA